MPFIRILNKNCEIILKNLIIADAPISSSDIQTSLDISRKTLTAEIQRMDSFLKKHGARIRTVHGIGYAIEKLDEERFNAFSEKFLLHVHRDRYMYFDRKYLAYLIIIELLVRDGYITVDELSQNYHYSSGMIAKNLQIAKSFFSRFRLQLISRAKYGITLAGSEWNKRVCILFTAKIANGINFLQGNSIPVIKAFREMLEKDLDNYFAIKHDVEPVLHKYGISCPLIYQMKICYYLFLTQSRATWYERLELKSEYPDRLRGTPFLAAAQELAEVFGKRGYVIKENDIVAIAIIIACYASRREICDLTKEQYALCEKDARNFLTFVSGLYPGVERRFDTEFLNEFTCFLAGIWERQFFGMPSDEEVIFPAKLDGIFASDLCVDFANMFQEIHGIILTTAELMEAYYIISSAFTRNAHTQAQYRAALVSFYGVHFARNMAVRLMQIYKKMIVEIVPMELGEANYVDLSRFDLIITDIARNQFRDMGLPVIFFDFYRDDYLRSLEKFISHNISSRLRNIVKAGSIRKGTHFHNKEEVFRYLADSFVHEAHREAFIGDCQKNNHFLSCERRNKIALVSVHPKYYNALEIAIIFNQASFYWDDELVQMVIFYNNRGKAYEDIKITNILIRRLLGDAAGIVQELSGMDAEELISYISNQKYKP